ncbi:hypothetical protein [Cryobacterium fucosi]|uniref:Uncharacterized protein n=1 Tax=Cryobacterium fucosi TaxID=1259157 RepID=A0A4R9BET8_9MICO|nr:hypothetical protein [Cryobacterium fucosi]TFD82515.1 hypothetical protein E3T48_02340 [Cryobacterium fucosi]
MFRTTPGTPAPHLPIKTAARYLGVSATPIRKGLASGVIPNLSLATVETLSRRDVLHEVDSVTGAPVPVLRLTPWQSETQDDAGAPPRMGIGYQHCMLDVDFLSSCDRWWPTSGRDQVLAAQAVLVAIGSIIVGWIDIDINKKIGVDSSGRLHYPGHIVARLDDVLGRSVRSVNTSSPNAAIAQTVMGLRVLGGGGGSITRLDPSAGLSADADTEEGDE